MVSLPESRLIVLTSSRTSIITRSRGPGRVSVSQLRGSCQSELSPPPSHETSLVNGVESTVSSVMLLGWKVVVKTVLPFSSRPFFTAKSPFREANVISVRLSPRLGSKPRTLMLSVPSRVADPPTRSWSNSVPAAGPSTSILRVPVEDCK